MSNLYQAEQALDQIAKVLLNDLVELYGADDVRDGDIADHLCSAHIEDKIKAKIKEKLAAQL